jgi:DNA replication protein DnaC
MRKTLDLRIAEASEQNLSMSEFLEILLEDEKTNREDNRRSRLYHEARFPFEKHLDEFDFSFQPSISKGKILELSTCKFVTQGENVIFIGQPGTGKTHLSVALGQKALSYGYTVLFTSVWEMITTLQQSRADHTYRKKIDQYLKPDLLILDELGYKTMGETTVEDFFEIVSKRYTRNSIIITSNRDFASWDKIFFDKTLTGAIIDRLIHHCHTFLITGDSFRFKNRDTD